MNTPYQVTILLDLGNNWIEPYVKGASALASADAYQIRISHDADAVSGQDIVFILGYTRILDAAFLGRNRLNLVVHESDLPAGKGFAPLQWQILEGKKAIPVCLIEAREAVDAGDILFRTEIQLDGTELYDEIRQKQAHATLAAIEGFLRIYPDFTPRPQSGAESFYRRRTKKDGELDVDKTIREQFDLLRIANNEEWPSYFYMHGQKYLLKIFREDKD